MFFAPDTSPRAEEMRRRMAEIAAEEARMQAVAARAAEERELAEIAAEQAAMDAARDARAAARDAAAAAAREKRRTDVARRRVGHAAVAPGVFLGNERASADAAFFTAEHITAVVNCTRDLPCVFESEAGAAVAYLRVPVDDSADAPLAMHLAGACAFVAAARERGASVLVHCREGRSRSAAVCAAYLMRAERLPLRDALARLDRDAWTLAINPGFMRVLMDDEAALFGTAAAAEEERECRPDMRTLHPDLDERQLRALCDPGKAAATGKEKREVREPAACPSDGQVFAIFAQAAPAGSPPAQQVETGGNSTSGKDTGKTRKPKGSGTLPRGQQSIESFFM